MKPGPRKKVGRPAKPPVRGARNSLGLRVTADLKNRIDNAAEQSGRSQSQEAEIRLERSFLDDDARDRELGGRQLRAFLDLLANAAIMIQEQTGKSCFEDRETWTAVHIAWRRLIASFTPDIPEEYLEAFATPLPGDPPVPPKPLTRGLLNAADWSEAGQRRHEAALADYEERRKRWERETTAWRAATAPLLERVREQARLGESTAASLLPEKPKTGKRKGK